MLETEGAEDGLVADVNESTARDGGTDDAGGGDDDFGGGGIDDTDAGDFGAGNAGAREGRDGGACDNDVEALDEATCDVDDAAGVLGKLAGSAEIIVGDELEDLVDDP